MYWTRFESEQSIPRDGGDYRSVVQYLDKQYGLELKNAQSSDQPAICGMKKKSLTFYKNVSPNRPNNSHSDLSPNNPAPASGEQPPVLFEVGLKLSAIDDKFGDSTLMNYEWTRVYLVRVCKEKTENTAKNSEDDYEWFLLDGESGVLHALNAKFGGITIDDPISASEYLDFFCSFLCGAEGAFVLVKDPTELENLDDQNQFEIALFESRHYIVHEEPKRFPEELSWDKIKNVLKERLEVREKTEPADTNKRLTRLKGVVLYGKEFFESTFNVSESGLVEMTEDKRINVSGDEQVRIDLAVRSFATVALPVSGLILFVKSGERRPMSAADFMAYTCKAKDVLYTSNLLINGDVAFGPGVALQGFECFNVQFLGDVKFDHCQVSSVLRFKKCQILGAFCSPGTRFQSQVVLNNSDIFALPRIGKVKPSNKQRANVKIERSGEDEGGYAIGLNLDHARIEGSLSLERLTVHGSAQGRQLSVMADANFCGLQVIPLVDSNGSKGKTGARKSYKAAPGTGQVLLDLRRSSVAGRLNLGIWRDKVKWDKRTHVTVCGDCRLDTMSVRKSLILEGLAVVKLDPEKVDLTKFPYADWPNTLSMSNMTIKGNIQSWEYDSWDLSGQTIPPPLVVDGTIDLKWSKIGGYVDLRMSRVRKDLDCIGVCAAWLTLESSRLNDVSSNDDTRRKTDEIDWIQYSVLAPSSLSSPVGKAPTEWMKSFAWRMSAIGGDLKLRNAIIPGGVTLTGTTVKGTVDVRLGAQLGQIKALPCFSIYTEFTEKEESGAKRQVPVKRTVVKQNASLGGLSICDSTIAGPVYLWGTQIEGVAGKNQYDAPKPAIDIATSTLKGGLYLHARSSWEGQETVRQFIADGCNWSDGPESKKVETKWSDHGGGEWKDDLNFEKGLRNYFWQTISNVFRTTVKGDVDILATDIGADVDLTNTEVKGRVRLNDSHVKCDVRAVRRLQELDVKDEVPPDSERKRALLAELQTQCDHFEFQSLRCDGDMLLAGLAVAGGVDGRNAVVRGHVEFVCDTRVTAILKSGSGQPNAACSAFIRKDLDLCGCEIGLLRIDGESFKTTANKIDLARVTVSTLEIVEPLPKQIDLQSIKVGTWKVKDPKALLKKTVPYDPWAYKSVENWLASTGKDAAADEVHVERNKRELKEEEEKYSLPDKVVGWISASFMVVVAVAVPIWPWSACILCLLGIILYCYRDQTGAHPLCRPLSWIRLKIWNRLILEKVMGFGTWLGPAFCIWFVLAFSLGLVLSDPHNVQPTFAAVNAGLGRADLKINTDVPADWEKLAKARNDLQKRSPKDWGFWNHALWLALDITVPLIPFNLHDEWEPKETTEGTAFPCCSQSEMLIAPKTLANIFTPLSWAIWTLIATGMAGLIRTRN